MIQGVDKMIRKDYCAGRGVQCKFRTPAAPHQNGCAEALVNSSKRDLRKAVGEHILTLFELYTCILEIANLVNQRASGRPPNDREDGSYLCSNVMRLGRASSQVPQGSVEETRNPRRRVEFVQKIVESFCVGWKCWTRRIPVACARRKWNVERRNARVDDVVAVAYGNAVGGVWTVGRIVKVYPGNVTVKTASGEYSRPVTKIAVIQPAEEQN